MSLSAGIKRAAGRGAPVIRPSRPTRHPSSTPSPSPSPSPISTPSLTPTPSPSPSPSPYRPPSFSQPLPNAPRGRGAPLPAHRNRTAYHFQQQQQQQHQQQQEQQRSQPKRSGGAASDFSRAVLSRGGRGGSSSTRRHRNSSSNRNSNSNAVSRLYDEGDGAQLMLNMPASQRVDELKQARLRARHKFFASNSNSTSANMKTTTTTTGGFDVDVMFQDAEQKDDTEDKDKDKHELFGWNEVKERVNNLNLPEGHWVKPYLTGVVQSVELNSSLSSTRKQLIVEQVTKSLVSL